MKKITVIFILFISVSCSYAPMGNSEPIIIRSVKMRDDKFCDYKGIGNYNMVFSFTSPCFIFRDTIGKFQVGDTINLVKK